MDVDTIYDLGPEGIPSLIRLTGASDPVVAETAHERLKWLAEGYYEVEYIYDDELGEYRDPVYTRPADGIGGWNYLRDNAFDQLDKYIEENGSLDY